MFLTPADVVTLTGKKQAAAQVRALRAMGIDHHVRPDGVPVVLERVLAGGSPIGKAKRSAEPNWQGMARQTS